MQTPAVFFCFAFPTIHFFCTQSKDRDQLSSQFFTSIIFLSFHGRFISSTPTCASYILLQISVRDQLLTCVVKCLRQTGLSILSTRLLPVRAALILSPFPFLLPASCQRLICIIHHRTQQPDSAHLMNRHRHWRCDHLQVFDLLSLPKVFGGCNSILWFLQAAPEVAVNYQVTLSATSHCVEPVVQLVLDHHC